MIMKVKDISDQPIFVVYKVSDWRKYWSDDPNAELVKTGINAWDARRIIRQLNANDFDGPLHPSGQPIGRYKYCSQENRITDRQGFSRQKLFWLGGLIMANVTSFMNQQLGALKDIEDLLNKAESQNITSVKQDDVSNAREYVGNMKTVCKTIIALEKAVNAPKAKEPEPKEVKKEWTEPKPETVETPAAPIEEKKPRSRKKAEPVKEELPPAQALEEPEPEDDDLDFLN